jgi:hypothetical protein
MEKLEYGKNYQVALGCSEAEEALYLGTRYAKRTKRIHGFLFLNHDDRVYFVELKNIEDRQDYLKLKWVSVKKLSPLERELVHLKPLDSPTKNL